MKKKIISLVAMLFVMLFAIDVKAFYDGAYTITKDDSYGELYNSLPTEVKKGDIITVKVKSNNSGYNIKYGSFTIHWDESAFEILETNKKMYVTDKSNIGIESEYLDEGSYRISYYFNDDVSDPNLFEFKFKVLSNAKDGIYKIFQTYGENFVTYENSNNEQIRYDESYYRVLKYQIGKEKLTSEYTPDSIDNNSYIIGSHLFNRDGSDEYPGVLTTEYIMLASKTIESNNKDDMIVYIKNASGIWKNAITNEEINTPEKFDITYINMKPTYIVNGLYSSSTNKTTLALTQYNDKKVIVTIENQYEHVHGVGTINKNVITLNTTGDTYTINVDGDLVTIQTNDNNLSEKEFTKRINYSVNDYYTEKYGNPYYLKSEITGKYSFNNYELYYTKINERAATMCLKEKTSNSCIAESSSMIYDNETYIYRNNYEIEYKVTINDDGITISSEDDPTYNGTYSKQSVISIESMLDLYEKEKIEYKVGYIVEYGVSMTAYGEFFEKGHKVTDYTALFSEIIGSDYKIEGWLLNKQLYDFNTPVTAPITLVAKVGVNIPTPELGDGRIYAYLDHNLMLNNLEDYVVGEYNSDNLSENEYRIDGYEVYLKDGDSLTLATFNMYIGDGSEYESVSTFLPYQYAEFDAEPLTKKTYVARTYIIDNGEKIYSDYSNEVEVDATIPTPVISFTQGDSSWTYDYMGYEDGIYTYEVGVNNLDDFGWMFDEDHNTWYNFKIDGFDLFEKVNGHLQPPVSFEPGSPARITAGLNEVKHYYVKAYVFVDGSKVYTDLSNELVVETHIPTPQIGFGMGDGHFAVGLFINNENDYCIGGCSNNVYLVDGYEICEKNGSNYTVLDTVNNPLSTNDFAADVNDATADKVYVVRMFINDGDDKIYSAYSNELVLEAISTPTLNFSTMGAGGDVPSRTQPLAYEGGHEGIVFTQDFSADYGPYLVCNPEDESDCESTVEGFEFFEKNGNTLTSFEDMGDGGGGVATAIIPSGSSKTFVVKAYLLGNNNSKIYSPASNEITIDLTNTTYTFEIIPSQSDTSKVNVRGYINGYEVSMHGIKIGDTMYQNDESTELGEFVTIDVALMENVDEIVLGLEQVSNTNPDNFVVEVTATRKTN